jgi:hypothetical protein
MMDARSRLSYEWLPKKSFNPLNWQKVVDMVSEHAGGSFVANDLLIVSWENVRIKSVRTRMFQQQCEQFCGKTDWCQTKTCTLCRACDYGVSESSHFIHRFCE